MEITNIETKEIDSILFGVFSNEEIRQISACKIDNTKLSDGPGSIYDIRMGTIENGKICGTCFNGPKDCPGHFAHIELNRSVLHPLFYRNIQDFLTCFCIKCYRLLLSEEQIELNGFNKYSGKGRFQKIIQKLKKVDECAHCDNLQPEFKFSTHETTIHMFYKSKGTFFVACVAFFSLFSSRFFTPRRKRKD